MGSFGRGTHIQDILTQFGLPQMISWFIVDQSFWSRRIAGLGCLAQLGELQPGTPANRVAHPFIAGPNDLSPETT